jgi:hypothetical protein
MPQGIMQVVTNVTNVVAQKTDEKANSDSSVVFGLDVNLDEAQRKSDSIKIRFKISMESDPPAAKFTIEGNTTVSGDSQAIENMVSADPKTNVPPIFVKIYQQIYSVMFLLAGTLGVPYPSPALLKRAHVQVQVADEIER